MIKRKEKEPKKLDITTEAIPTRLSDGSPYPLPKLSHIIDLAHKRLSAGEKTEEWIAEWRECASSLYCLAEDAFKTSRGLFSLKERCWIERRRKTSEHFFMPILKWRTFREFSSWLYRAVVQSIESGSKNTDLASGKKIVETVSLFLYTDRERLLVERQVKILNRLWSGLVKIEVQIKNVGPKEDPVRCCVFLRLRNLDSIPPDTDYEVR